jgi:hypothetical protein
MNNKKFYYQDYAKTLGNFDAGVILHKLHSWQKCMKDKREGGIFYKSRPELAEETGLSIQRIRSATKFLVQNGWIEITVKGAPPTCWYKVNHDKIMSSLETSENTYPLDFTQLVADCDVQVIDYSQNVAPTFQNVAPTFPYQYIHNTYEDKETDTSYPKERELLRNSLPAEPVASPQPLESASMKKKSPPESVDLADVLADQPVRRAKRQVSVAQQTVRRAYSEVRQPHVDFMPAVADAWRDIVTNIESMGKKPGIIALSRWQQTILDYQAKHGAQNTVAWLNRLIEKNVEWIYPIEVDDLKFKPKTKPKYESRDNVIDIYQNLT